MGIKERFYWSDVEKVGKERFILVANKYISENSEQHLSQQELYLYSYLRRKSSLDMLIDTTISLISHFMSVPYLKTERRNEQRVKDVLFSLLDKKVIDISTESEKISANTPIRVSFHSFKEHTAVPYDVFDSINDISDYYIYVCTARWRNSSRYRGAFKCSLNKWENLLKVTKRTATVKIENAIRKGLIYKNTGDYTDGAKDNMQNINLYRTTPFSKSEKTDMTKIKEWRERKNAQKLEEFKDDNSNSLSMSDLF